MRLSDKRLRLLAFALAASAALSGCQIADQKVDDDGPLYKSQNSGISTEKVITDSVPESEETLDSSSDSTAVDESSADRTEPAADSGLSEKVTKVLSEMSTEEKVAQLFVIRVDVLEEDKPVDIGVTWVDDDMKAMLGKYPVGGVFYSPKNVKDEEQLTKLSADLQAAAKYPLFITADEEGGSVARISDSTAIDVPTFDSMLEIGESGDTDKAKEVGETIGTYLSEFGLNLDLAPVADIYSNSDNTVIGDRAFGKDAATVSSMVSACIDGFHSKGVMTCLKHFPGHGDTSEDTHDGFVSVEKTWDELLDEELIPFADNLDKTDMVMVAHITLPNVSDDGLPASLSKVMITDKLRGELGYNGVVITDALAMGAIEENYKIEDSAVKVIEAGADLILMPSLFVDTYDAVLAAVNSGDISAERLDESVGRILTLKEKYGLI